MHMDISTDCLLHWMKKWWKRKVSLIYSKTRHKRPLKNRKKAVLMTNGSLMKVQSIAECSPWSILQYFWPALRDNWSRNPIFGLFESGCFRQVLLYLCLRVGILMFCCFLVRIHCMDCCFLPISKSRFLSIFTIIFTTYELLSSSIFSGSFHAILISKKFVP